MSPKVQRRDLPVLVHGATGYTGRLVARELIRTGTSFGISGRTARKLADLATELAIPVPQFVIPEGDSAALPEVLANTRIVINCAGPFIKLGAPVVKAAISAGTHYLDVTGEQEFVRRCHAQDREAKVADCAVVPSMAFEVSLADMAAQLAAEKLAGDLGGAAPFDEVTILYDMHRVRASRGTQKSALRMLAGVGLVVENGELVERVGPPGTHALMFPGDSAPTTGVEIPGADIVTVPRHVKCRRMHVYMSAGRGIQGWLARKLLPLGPWFLGTAAGRGLRHWIESQPTGEGPPDSERPTHEFRIAAEVRAGGRRALAVVGGRDPYGLTATIAVAAARAMMEPGYTRTGALSPSMAFDSRRFLESLAPAGVTLDVLEPA